MVHLPRSILVLGSFKKPVTYACRVADRLCGLKGKRNDNACMRIMTWLRTNTVRVPHCITIPPSLETQDGGVSHPSQPLSLAFQVTEGLPTANPSLTRNARQRGFIPPTTHPSLARNARQPPAPKTSVHARFRGFEHSLTATSPENEQACSFSGFGPLLQSPAPKMSTTTRLRDLDFSLVHYPRKRTVMFVFRGFDHSLAATSPENEHDCSSSGFGPF